MPGRIQDRHILAISGASIVLALAAVSGVHWLATVLALGSLALLAAVNPTWLVAAVVLSIPVQDVVMLPFVRGSITVTQLLLFALFIGWGALFWRRRIWLDSVVVGFLLVVAAYAISFIAVESPGLWFQETYRWAVAGVFYIVCRSVVTDWSAVRLAIAAMAIGVVGVSVGALWQAISLNGPEHFLAGGTIRVYGSFGTPNTMAAYLEMTVPLLIACVPIAWWGPNRDRFHRIEQWLMLAAIAVGGVVIALTQSRGGALGMIAALAVIWIQLTGRTRLITAGIAVVALAGFLVTSPGQSQVDRFLELRSESSSTEDRSEAAYRAGAGRGALWAAAIDMIEDNPLTGVGAGEFDEHYREYAVSWLERYPRGQAHNVWLQMGAQAGIWGIMAYAWWLAASLWSVITARRRVDSRPEYWIITGVLAAFFAYAVHSMVDYLNVLSLGLQLSVLTAIALNLAPEPLTRYRSAYSPTTPEPALCPQ